MKDFRNQVLALLLAAGVCGCHWQLRYLDPEDAAREVRLEAAVMQVPGTPAEFAGMGINSPTNLPVRALLAEIPTVNPEWSDPAVARRRLAKLEQDVKLGLAWRETPPKFVLPKLSGPAPVLDGVLAPGEWTTGWTARGSYLLNGTEHRDDGTEWRLAYDDQRLYFAAFLPDCEIVEDPETIHPYRNDSFEIFLFPDERLHTYYEIVITPAGRVHQTESVRTPQTYSVNFRAVRPSLRRAVRRNAAGYTVEGSVEFSDLAGHLLGNPVLPGEKMRFVMVRTDRDHADEYRRFVPFPLLYDGHNTTGYAELTLE